MGVDLEFSVRRLLMMRGCSPPPRAAYILRDADPEESDPSATIQALRDEFVILNRHHEEPWSYNLIERATLRCLHPQIIAFLLDEFRRYKRRRPCD